MKSSIGVRLDEEFIKKLESIGEDEKLDRSTIIRKLLEKGYREYLKEKAAEKYRSEEVTISKAAEIAETTIWDMERYLVENGYVSEYSAKDLMDELENL
ncbi:MAG: UPF0175 family protein [Thermoplasmata archaeon]